jgi:hypothetical protein
LIVLSILINKIRLINLHIQISPKSPQLRSPPNLPNPIPIPHQHLLTNNSITIHQRTTTNIRIYNIIKITRPSILILIDRINYIKNLISNQPVICIKIDNYVSCIAVVSYGGVTVVECVFLGWLG